MSHTRVILLMFGTGVLANALGIVRVRGMAGIFLSGAVIFTIGYILYITLAAGLSTRSKPRPRGFDVLPPKDRE